MLSRVSSGLTTIVELSVGHLLAIAGLVAAAVAKGYRLSAVNNHRTELMSRGEGMQMISIPNSIFRFGPKRLIESSNDFIAITR